MSESNQGGPLFNKLPAELQNDISSEVRTTLQFLIDADIQTYGKVTADTLGAITTQGYAYQYGRLEKLTALQIKAAEIARRYDSLPMMEKVKIIAWAFGCKSGRIEVSPCRGKWRGTSDVSIRFDNGTSLHIGNRMTPKAKTAKAQSEFVNAALERYNPEIIAITKEAAYKPLKEREKRDNMIAAQKGLKPYTLLNVEFHDGTSVKDAGYMGWYYVTLAVDGVIHAHMETGLAYDIAGGKVSDAPTRDHFFVAGALKEAEIDYVFNNVGFSSSSTLYTLPINGDVLERARAALAEHTKTQTGDPAVTHPPHRRKPHRSGPER